MKRGFWVVLMVATIGVVVGCTASSRPLTNTAIARDNTQAQLQVLEALNRELEARIKGLEARNQALADRLSPGSRSVNLLNPVNGGAKIPKNGDVKFPTPAPTWPASPPALWGRVARPFAFRVSGSSRRGC